MYQELDFHIRGVLPTIMHNGRLNDPFYRYSRELKKISGKTKKTDEDLMKMREIEFLGGLYVEEGEEKDDGGPPVWPAENIHAMLIAAAKMSKRGRKVEQGVMFSAHAFPLIYKGPKTKIELWKNQEKFLFVKKVKVMGRGIMRARPIFREWDLKFQLNFLTDVLDATDIRDLVVIAGKLVGLSDYRPRYGMFDLVEWSGNGKR